MGAWGHKALESDNGLDVIDCIKDYVSSKYPNTNPIDLTLSEVVNTLQESGLLSGTFDEIDFLYDNSAMALTELYLMFKRTGQIDYEDEEDEIKDLKKRVKSFTGDQKSFSFLLKCLMDIKNEVPDEDGIRETVELWKDTDSYKEWLNHLDSLIDGFKTETQN
ncbi:MAG: DUF4259 domain-containing protein [Flavobacterium sp.]|nr:MAG: DUF4259 domain-containing protein [Flavobacterium sp.]